jgi:hypothetical protein
MAKGELRDKMPVVAALIDDLRSAFGKESIDKIIREGISGKPVFMACENGHTVGTPLLEGTRVVKDERGTRCIVVAPNGERCTYKIDAGRRKN